MRGVLPRRRDSGRIATDVEADRRRGARATLANCPSTAINSPSSTKRRRRMRFWGFHRRFYFFSGEQTSRALARKACPDRLQELCEHYKYALVLIASIFYIGIFALMPRYLCDY